MDKIVQKSNGALLLGGNVSCDGFSYDHEVRVQTHIHSDHMVDFNTSKANQTVVTSEETLDLLKAIYDHDLLFRDNLVGLARDTEYCVNGDTISLFPSHHMLGSSQVAVKCADGSMLGYSSDFFWPLEEVINVDELIVDSTYGSPDRIREYSQEMVDEILQEATSRHLASESSVAIIGYNGRLHHALSILGDSLKVPILCSKKCHPLIDVYRKYGHALPRVISTESEDALNILRNKEKCVCFATFTDRRHLPWIDRFKKITLSAHMVGPKSPILDYDNGDCAIAFTDHADFESTIDYVKATGAKKVWTDPRTGNAEELAYYLSTKVGIPCAVITRLPEKGWG